MYVVLTNLALLPMFLFYSKIITIFDLESLDPKGKQTDFI